MTSRMTNHIRFPALAFFGFLLAVCPLAATRQTLALTDAVVLNPANESVRRGVLLIEGGMISGFADTIPADFAGRNPVPKR